MNFLKIQGRYKYFKNSLYTRLLKGNFGRIGKKTYICPPFHSNNAKQIYIGDNCIIHSGSWLECVEKYGKDFSPRIDIGEGTYIGNGAHIIACSHMKIGKNVLFANGVYISDNLHGYEDINTPIMAQTLINPGPVTIEDEVWLGENVCVLPNVTIGRHSVVGANSVVTKDIPPYSVAVGTPAKVIKQYNEQSGKWEKV
jgi:acetyltransferase-like isoleucine patch superfamily enzyme